MKLKRQPKKQQKKPLLFTVSMPADSKLEASVAKAKAEYVQALGATHALVNLSRQHKWRNQVTHARPIPTTSSIASTPNTADATAHTLNEDLHFCCDRDNCESITFTLRQAQQRNSIRPFDWDEKTVTMCLHGQMAPLIEYLQWQCEGMSKCHVHLQSGSQQIRHKGFVRGQDTPDTLVMQKTV